MNNTEIKIEVTRKPSKSKGWARYSAVADGVSIVPTVTRRNDWVDTSSVGEVSEGSEIELTCEIMNNVGKSARQEIVSQTYALIADPTATCEIDYQGGLAQGIRLTITGARLAE